MGWLSQLKVKVLELCCARLKALAHEARAIKAMEVLPLMDPAARVVCTTAKIPTCSHGEVFSHGLVEAATKGQLIVNVALRPTLP